METDRLRVLVFAPRVPWPPDRGASIRNFHVLRALARQHRVTLLAFGDPESDPGPLEQAGVDVLAVPHPPARSGVRRLADLITTSTPDLVRRLDSESMRHAARLQALVKEPFDVVLVEGLEMVPFGIDVLQATPLGLKARLVYDAHNAEWVLQQRAWEADSGRVRRWPAAGYSLIQTLKLRRYEARVLRMASTTVAVSEADAGALRRLAPDARVVVAPNGVDTGFFTPGDHGAVEEGLCVFTGKMDFRPNVDAVTWFCREVWPLVAAGRPGATFAIVGRDPSPAVRALAAIPGVLVTGPVTDVRPWLARAGVFVAPLRVGGGTRLKILEAMAMEKAVVATPVAVEGLAVEPGQEVVLADSPASMSDEILRLGRDPGRRQELGRAARRRTEFQYRWEQVGWRIEAVVRNGTAF